MEYYGNLDYERLVTVARYEMNDVNNPNTAVGYLNNKDILFDFIINQQKEEAPISEYRDCSSLKKKKRNKEYYYIGIVKERARTKEIGSTKTEYVSYYTVWKKLPRIGNDKTFKWKENLKYGTKETVIIQGNFEFSCIVKADGDAIVDVRYAKCDNKHRNRVTITRIDVYNASNQEILNAIKEWKKMFQKEMNEETPNIRLAS